KATTNLVKTREDVPQKLRFFPNAGFAIRSNPPILMRWPWAPGGLTGVVEQGPEHHPVVGPHGGSSIGTAGGIFVEGAGSPDVRAIAMDLGVIDGRDMIAVPEPPGG